MHQLCQVKIPNSHFSTFTRPQKPLSFSVVVVIIMAGMIAAPSTANQPQERLGTVQVIAIMSSELFEVTSCMTSWYHDLFTKQIPSCMEGKDDFIFKYCCNTPGKRRRASMACEYHKTTADPLAPAFRSLLSTGICWFQEKLMYFGS